VYFVIGDGHSDGAQSCVKDLSRKGCRVVPFETPDGINDNRLGNHLIRETPEGMT